MTGTLPASLGNILSMQRVFLGFQNLYGTIPASFVSLTNMRLLALNGNQMYGSIPPALGNRSEPNGPLQLALDNTFCWTPLGNDAIDSLYDYAPNMGVYTALNADGSHTVSTTCPPRPCPRSSYSTSGFDSDGSGGGCTACPPGLFISDPGGVSSAAAGVTDAVSAAAHAGAGKCSPPPPSPPPMPPSPPPPPLPPVEYSTGLPRFSCMIQDSTCAALGDLYAASAGEYWFSNAGWAEAAAGIPTDYCVFALVQCSNGVVNAMYTNNVRGLRRAHAADTQPDSCPRRTT